MKTILGRDNYRLFTKVGLSLLLFLIHILSALLGLIWKFEITILLYFSATVFLIVRDTKIVQSFLVLIIPLLIPLVYSIINISTTRYSLPGTIAPFMGIGAALLFSRVGRVWKATVVLLLVALSVWFGLIGRDMWRTYSKYGSRESSISEPFPTINFYTPDSVLISAESQPPVVKVFDLWTIHCAPCFKAFPEWSAWKDAYANQAGIEFMAVNLPAPNQTYADVRRVLAKFVNVQINPVVTDDAGLLFFQKQLQIYTVPTTVVVVNNEVRFRGDMVGAKQFVKEVVKAF